MKKDLKKIFGEAIKEDLAERQQKDTKQENPENNAEQA
jgi:hypothetical protein